MKNIWTSLDWFTSENRFSVIWQFVRTCSHKDLEKTLICSEIVARTLPNTAYQWIKKKNRFSSRNTCQIHQKTHTRLFSWCTLSKKNRKYSEFTPRPRRGGRRGEVFVKLTYSSTLTLKLSFIFSRSTLFVGSWKGWWCCGVDMLL